MGCSLGRYSFGEQQKLNENSNHHDGNGHTRSSTHSCASSSCDNISSSSSPPPRPPVNDAQTKQDEQETSARILMKSANEINQLGAQNIDLGQRRPAGASIGRGSRSATTTTRGGAQAEPAEMSRDRVSLKRKLAVGETTSAAGPARASDKERSRANKGNTFASLLIALLVKRRRHSSARIEAADTEGSLAAGDGPHPQLAHGSANGRARLEPAQRQTVGSKTRSNQFATEHVKSKLGGGGELRMSPPARLDASNTSPTRAAPEEARAQQPVRPPRNGPPPARSPSPAPSVSQQAETSSSAAEVLLFTSVQQLCYQIIGQRFLMRPTHEPSAGALAPSPANKGHQHHHQDTLCLFMFGRQGSSMGELAYELVEHSSLVTFMDDHCQHQAGHKQHQDGQRASANATGVRQARPKSAKLDGRECPLYHYIDVTSLIVANIDGRIREYNRLVAQTLRARRQELVCEEANGVDREIGSSVDCSSAGRGSELGSLATSSQDDDHDEDGSGSRTGLESVLDSASVWSRDATARELSIEAELLARPQTGANGARPSSATSARCPHHHKQQPQAQQPPADQFGMATLSTRQRSILQLKMIKYATCVTAKWIMLLTQNEIAKLEAQLKRLTSLTSCCDDAPTRTPPPTRVYLINLVPNQLSLFKTCLYLQQELPLATFRHRYQAIKFERRTNIKLTAKERGTGSIGRSSEGSSPGQTGAAGPGRPRLNSAGQDGNLFQRLKLPQLKLPTILVPRSNSEPSIAARDDEQEPQRPMSADDDGQQQRSSRQLELTATSLIANSVNEKLAPKFSENFASQFRKLDKLVQLRYNPIKNYNYDTTDPFDAVSIDHTDDDDERPAGLGAPADTTSGRTSRSSGRSWPSHGCYLRLSQLEHSRARTSSPPASPVMSISPDGADSGRRRPLSAIDTCQTAASPRGDGRLSDGQRLRPDQARDRHHLASPSSPSVISNCSSDLSGVSSLFQMSSRHSQLVSPHTAGASPKWAVELELSHSGSHENTDNCKWYSRTARGPGGEPSHDLDAIGGHCLAGGGAAVHGTDLQRSTPAPPTTNCCLHVYQPPARRSRSPFSAMVSTGNASGHRSSLVPATVCHADHYYLVWTRVAYAKGKSQTILEAKSIHRRVFHYSAPSDLPRLLKMIVKARARLAADLDGWLRAAIESAHSPAAATAAAASQSADDHSHHNHHHPMAAAAQLLHQQRPSQPLLVTCTIRVDLLKMLRRTSNNAGDEQQRPVSRSSSNSSTLAPAATTEQQRHPCMLSPSELAHLLRMQPERPALSKRPASALAGGSANRSNASGRTPVCSRLSLQPPGVEQPDGQQSSGRSSLGDHSTKSAEALAASSGKQRHVQFRLGRAPQIRSDHDEHHQGRTGRLREEDVAPAQRRIWMGESLFVSCAGGDEEPSPAVDLFVDELAKFLSNSA
jgi:hypothetical protein